MQWLLDIDKSLFLLLSGDAGAFADTFFYYVSARLTWVPLYLAILYFIWRRKGTRGLLFAILFLVVALAAADQLCNLFKNHWAPKLRPTHTPALQGLVHTVRGYTGGLYGTISAHAAISFVIATFTARIFRRRWYTAAICGWALLVSYSRIYLGVHFPLDVFLGILLGTALGWLAFRGYDRWILKRKGV